MADPRKVAEVMLEAAELVKLALEAWERSGAGELEFRVDVPEQSVEVTLRREARPWPPTTGPLEVLE